MGTVPPFLVFCKVLAGTAFTLLMNLDTSEYASVLFAVSSTRLPSVLVTKSFSFLDARVPATIPLCSLLCVCVVCFLVHVINRFRLDHRVGKSISSKLAKEIFKKAKERSMSR
jgi:hypothetical protein